MELISQTLGIVVSITTLANQMLSAVGFFATLVIITLSVYVFIKKMAEIEDIQNDKLVKILPILIVLSTAGVGMKLIVELYQLLATFFLIVGICIALTAFSGFLLSIVEFLVERPPW